MRKNAVALAALLAALAGCAPVPPSSPAPALPAPSAAGAAPALPDAGTISFAAPAAARSYYQPLIAAFEAAHPQSHIAFVDADAAVSAGLGQGDLRALAQAADTGLGIVTPEDVASRTVLDLRPLMLADAQFDRADYYPRALAPLGGTADGGIYALPRMVVAPVLAFDNLLLDRVGLPLPSGEGLIVWGDLLKIAQAVSATSTPSRQVWGMMTDDLGFAAFIGDTERLSPAAFGQPLRLGQPGLADALALASQRAEHRVIWQPGAMSGAPDQAAADLVAQHRLGIWDARYRFAAQAPEDVAYLPAPETAFPIDLPAQQGWFISAGTASPQLAWQWLAFLSIQRPPDDLRMAPNEVYARRSLNAQTNRWAGHPPVLRQAVERALAYAPQQRPTTAAEWATVRQLWDEVARQHGAAAPALADAERSLAAAVAAPTAAALSPVVATPAPTQPGQAIIRFGSNVDSEALRPVLHQFEQQHPEIAVALTQFDVFEGDLATEAFAQATQQQDCFSWPTPPPSALAESTRDLQPLIAADAAFDLGDYPAALLDRLRAHGRLSALPFALELRALGYNAALVSPDDLAALPSFAALVDVAQRSTVSGTPQRRYGYALRFGPPQDLGYVLGQAGGSISRASAEGPQPDFLNPAAVEAIRSYVDLLRVASPYRSLPGYHGGEMQIGYIEMGQAALWTTFDATGATFGAGGADGFDPHVLPLPRSAGRASPDDMRISTFVISNSTPSAEVCWQLIKALGAAPGMVPSGQFPARVSLARSPQLREHTPPEALAVYDSYRDVLARPAPADSADLFVDPLFDPYWLYEAVDAALAGDDLEQALERAQDTTTGYLACVRLGAAGIPCAQQVDASYQGIGPIGPR